MQIETPLIKDCQRVSKVSWKSPISTFYSFAIICSWNFLFSQKTAYFLTVCYVFSVYEQIFKAQ